MNETSSGPKGRLASSLICFLAAMVIAALLIVAAAVIWLAEQTGSLIMATLIMGLFFALMALAIYQLSLKDALKRLNRQLETIYSMARIAQKGYEWITQKLEMLLLILENFRGK